MIFRWEFHSGNETFGERGKDKRGEEVGERLITNVWCDSV
jgi:hypothetical protein